MMVFTRNKTSKFCDCLLSARRVASGFVRRSVTSCQMKEVIELTTQQVAYAKVLEERRHNREAERLTGQANQINQQQADTASRGQVEQGRHNVETERTNWWSAQETQRHNVQQEMLNAFQAQSTARLQSAQAEGVLRQAGVAERQATVSERNAELRANELAESIRHNQVYEMESQRHNQYQESIWTRQQNEAERANRASEGISRSQVGLGYAQLAESSRSNRVGEALRHQQISEMQRANQAQESIATTRNRETARSNRAVESETIRANRARELATRTANRITERRDSMNYAINEYNATSQRYVSVGRAAESISSIARTFTGLSFMGG